MSIGTITLTQNSAVVTGDGTAFTSELSAGDVIFVALGGVNYSLIVSSIESDTSLKLARVFIGDTQSNITWSVIPQAALIGIHAQIAADTAWSRRASILDKQNWQAVFSSDGSITVRLPDGSSFTGPSWNSIVGIIKTLDIEYLDALASQINQDSQQVETNKNTVINTASQVAADAQTATDKAAAALLSETNAARSESNAEDAQELSRKYAINPEDQPVRDGEYSSFHFSEKARRSAEEAAAHNPAESLLRSMNLSDLADRAAAWLNVRPLGSTPLAGDAVNPYDAPTLRQVENLIGGGGGLGPTMNGVQNFGVGLPTLWTSRAFIPAWAVVADGELLNRVDWPELWAHAQMHTPIDDAVWLADKTKRGNYSNGDGSTTFRVPDFNGVQDGSIRGLYGRGDGGGYYVPGTVFENAVPNITGSFSGGSTVGGSWLAPPIGSAVGAFGLGANGTLSRIINASVTAVTAPANITFDASNSSPVYGRANTSEVRPNTFAGVWIIRASGGFVAANTSWSVINSINEEPESGTYNNGGIIRSDFNINGVRVGSLIGKCIYHDGIVDGTIAVSNSENGNYKEWTFKEEGLLVLPQSSNSAGINMTVANSDKAMKIDAYIKSRSLFAYPGSAIGVEASEANEIRLQSAYAGQSAGLFINYLQGRWYSGSYQFGGVRSTSTALQRVQLNVSSGVGDVASFMFNPSGIAQAAQWQNTSDRRIKSCIETIPNPLEVMRSIRGYSWFYEPYGTQGFGFMADEAEKHFPGAVKTTDDYEVEMPDGEIVRDIKSMDTYGIAAALHHEAILKLMEEVEALKTELASLKG